MRVRDTLRSKALDLVVTVVSENSTIVGAGSSGRAILREFVFSGIYDRETIGFGRHDVLEILWLHARYHETVNTHCG